MRKQYYNSAKKRKEEMKKVEDLVISFSVIRHDIRFTLKHDKDLIWQVNYLKRFDCDRVVVRDGMGKAIYRIYRYIGYFFNLWSILPIMVKGWTLVPESSTC